VKTPDSLLRVKIPTPAVICWTPVLRGKLVTEHYGFTTGQPTTSSHLLMARNAYRVSNQEAGESAAVGLILRDAFEQECNSAEPNCYAPEDEG
jgi:hypothetical protein